MSTGATAAASETLLTSSTIGLRARILADYDPCLLFNAKNEGNVSNALSIRLETNLTDVTMFRIDSQLEQIKKGRPMTNEEMQKAMEFIVNQQAQASAKIDGILEAQKEAQKEAQESWARNEERWKESQERWNERWTRTEEGIRALLSIAEIHEREIESLGQKIGAVSENGRATDDRLSALINVVERQISEGRNGNPGKS